MDGLTNTSKIKINRLIDHTILRSDATFTDIKRYSDEAESCQFYALCVAPCWVARAKPILQTAKLCSVAGFPLGSQTTKMKVFEIEELKNLGVDEIDVVASIGFIVSRDYKKVENEIVELVKAKEDRILKVIIETPLLSKDMIEDMTRLLIAVGCDFVKTGTGFRGSVKVADVKAIARVAGKRIGIKAAGGIRTYRKAASLIKAGATRIGTSTGVRIINAS